MGDQLAKGWADKKAQDPGVQWAKTPKPDLLWTLPWPADGAPSLNPTEAEVQAEEDMLP